MLTSRRERDSFWWMNNMAGVELDWAELNKGFVLLFLCPAFVWGTIKNVFVKLNCEHFTFAFVVGSTSFRLAGTIFIAPGRT